MTGSRWIVALLFFGRCHSFVINIPQSTSTGSLKHVLKSQGQREAASDVEASESEAYRNSLAMASEPYFSCLMDSRPEWKAFVDQIQTHPSKETVDLLWELIKTEASGALGPEPEAGPQLYQGILSKPSLVEAVITVISHEIESELIPATALRNLFCEMLTPEDEVSIHLDVMAVAMRSPSVGNTVTATLFQRGFHALVCYRVGHRLWEQGRTGLAYFMQSVVSRKFSADIHPAAKIDGGIYLSTGGGVVIGETAAVGQDTSILQGVTLGGTGKEAGNRHPKVGRGVILHAGSTVLGNIQIGEGSVITAKSIVTKPVPPLARVSGVPAKIKSYRNVSPEEFGYTDLEKHLAFKYMDEWQELARQREAEENTLPMKEVK